MIDIIKTVYAHIYDMTIGNISSIYTKTSRAISFAIIGWSNFDFDDHYVLELIIFKLKRMLYLFENEGNHDPGCENYIPKMKSIKLAIKLGERYINDDYYRFYDLHDKKYGKVDIDWEPIEGSTNSIMINTKDGIKYERTKQERKDLTESFRMDERDKAKDRRNFYKIIEKYGRFWWD